jgi:hypothetical protein
MLRASSRSRRAENGLLTFGVRPAKKKSVFTLIPKQDHLVCFLGGSFMLGALSSSPASAWRSSSRDDLDDLQPYAQEDWSVGHELIRTCYDTYRGTKSKLAPEIAMFRLEDEAEARFEDWYIKQCVLFAVLSASATSLRMLILSTFEQSAASRAAHSAPVAAHRCAQHPAPRDRRESVHCLSALGRPHLSAVGLGHLPGLRPTRQTAVGGVCKHQECAGRPV